MRTDGVWLFAVLLSISMQIGGCGGPDEGNEDRLEAEIGMSETAITASTPKSLIAAGGWHTCGVTNGNEVKCWGRNDYGQLGIGYDGAPVLSPTLVPGLTGIVTITAGESHTCALKSNGTVWCWGSNEYWQLGIGADPVAPWQSSPQQVIGPNNSPLQNVVAITAGGNHTCAVTNQGLLRCWGNNDVGQLGVDPNFVLLGVADPPVQQVGTFKSIGLGRSHTCARTSLSQVWCWGDNSSGQLGQDPDMLSWSASPLKVAGISAMVVDAGGYHTCALASSGAPKCWGLNNHGQLADCTLNPYWQPTVPCYTLSATALSLGDFHTCYAAVDTGGAKCSGFNSNAQIGNGGLSDEWVNDKVKTGLDTYLSQVQDIAAGAEHTCAMLTGKKISCWGSNADGQLGIGTDVALLGVAAPSLF